MRPIADGPFAYERSRTMANPTTPITYSVNDAIAVSSIGRTRLYELISDGTLARVKVGRRTLVNAGSLRALLENGT